MVSALSNYTAKAKAYGPYNRVTASANSILSSYSQTATTASGSVKSVVSNYNVIGNNMILNKNLSYRGGTIDIGSNNKLASKAGLSTTYGKGEVKLSAYITDEITPTVIELEIWAGEVMGAQMASAFKQSITGKVKQKYNSRNDGHWAPNHPNWKKQKAHRGEDTRPMHQHDKHPQRAMYGSPLSQTVKGFGKVVQVDKVGETYEVRGLDQEFGFNPYVWFHEVGYTTNYGANVPARPFIFPALNESVAQATRMVMNRTPIEKKKRGMTKTMRYTSGEPYSLMQYQMQTKRAMADFMMYLWWFMPQIQEYQYLGYLHDIQGYMSGHFLSVDVLKHFIKSLALGKGGQVTGIPLTTKLGRRASRKALWGSQSVSLTGGG